MPDRDPLRYPLDDPQPFSGPVYPEPAPVTITLPPARLAEARYAEDGLYVVPSEECAAGCNQLVSEGDPVRHIAGLGWVHDACAVRRITGMQVDEAWLVLADEITRRPSAFKASDIRAVMQNVARIARTNPPAHAAPRRLIRTVATTGGVL